MSEYSICCLWQYPSAAGGLLNTLQQTRGTALCLVSIVMTSCAIAWIASLVPIPLFPDSAFLRRRFEALDLVIPRSCQILLEIPSHEFPKAEPANDTT